MFLKCLSSCDLNLSTEQEDTKRMESGTCWTSGYVGSSHNICIVTGALFCSSDTEETSSGKHFNQKSFMEIA